MMRLSQLLISRHGGARVRKQPRRQSGSTAAEDGSERGWFKPIGVD